MTNLNVRNAKGADGPALDLSIRHGRITAMASSRGAPPDSTIETLDATGYVLLPALVESHVHLDKTLWGDPWRPNSAGPLLKDFITNERRVLASVTTPIARRAGALLERMIASGSLHVRSHIDIAPDIGLKHVEAMLALREAFRDRVDLGFVAFPQTGLLTQPGTAELMEEALRMGVETVGGLDPAGIDNDPIGQLRTVFGLAKRHGRGVDIHLHDPGELGLWQVERIGEFASVTGLAGKVMISHAYCLGGLPQARIEPVAQRLADAGVAIMTTAPADTTAPPVALLREAGVTVCTGNDGIRDAWSPLGTGDMLERAMMMALRFDWTKDQELAAALDTATYGGAKALGLSGYGLSVGNAADLVLVRAEKAGDAIARRPRERIVLRGGRVVAREGVCVA